MNVQLECIWECPDCERPNLVMDQQWGSTYSCQGCHMIVTIDAPEVSVENKELVFRQLQKEIHSNAVQHGWWKTFENGKAMEKNPLEIHALIHSEIAEATEEARKEKPSVYCVYEGNELQLDGTYDEGNAKLPADYVKEAFLVCKPEGELVELADAVIRVMDYCESRGWDLGAAITLKHEYNKTRPFRHGGKKY